MPQLLQNIPIYFLFLIVTSSPLMNKMLQMKCFSHVELAYDVATRRNIPVNILFTSLTTDSTDPKLLSGWM